MTDYKPLKEFPQVTRLTLAAAGSTVPKNEDIERVAVAFGKGVCVLAVCGAGVETEWNDGGIADCFRNGATNEDPEAGIWVWEGVPVALWVSDWENGKEFDGFDFSRGTWRQATVEELQDLVGGVSPWRSVLSEAEIESVDPAASAFEGLFDLAK